MDTLGQRFRDGDDRALEELYRRYSGALYGTAYGLLRDAGLAADAVQRTFFQAWQAAAGYDPSRPIEPWLYAILRRVAIDLHRGRRRFVPVDTDELEARAAGRSDGGLERAWLTSQVRVAIDELPAGDRAVVRLSYYADLPQQVISERLGIPVGTVKSRLHRAHRQLAGRLAHTRDGGTVELAVAGWAGPTR